MLRRLAAPGAVLLVALLATWPAGSGRFIYDDQYYVVENPSVSGDAPVWTSPLGTPGQALWRPVTVASFRAQWTEEGGAGPFRRFNIVLHALTALAVWQLARRWTGQTASALVAGLLFAAHPVHAEAVAWVSGRAELLAALFVVVAWIFHLGDRRGSAIASAAFLVLAGLSKENALAAPAIFVVGDLVVRRRPLPWMTYAAQAGAVGLVCLGRTWVLTEFLPTGAPYADYSLSDRLVVAANILGTSLRLLCWPDPLKIHYHRDEFVLPLTSSFVWIGLGIVAVLILRRRDRAAATALLLVPVSMITVLNLVPIGATFAERFLYLPSVAFCLFAGGALGSLAAAERRGRGLGASLLATALLLALAVPTSRAANRVLADDLSIWAHAAKVAPSNAHARYNHGYFLHEAGRYRTEDTSRPGSADELWSSLLLDPNHFYAGFAHQMLGNQAMTAMGRWIPDLELAAYHFRESAQRLPTLPDPVVNLATIALSSPDVVDPVEGVARLQRLQAAVVLEPEQAEVVRQLLDQLSMGEATGTSSEDGS